MKQTLRILLILLFTGLASLQGRILQAQQFPVELIQYKGSPNEFLNLVILPDGYTQNEQDKLIEDAINTSATFLDEEPFASVRDRINIFAIKVVSNESGAAMHPSGLIDNYFGSSYWSYNIERLLVAWHTHRITSVLLANTPFYDIGVVMVNHPKYGGSGGEFAVFSMNEQASELMLHELGHSLSDLSDEYWAGPEYARENTNMTQDNNPATIRWRDFLDKNYIGIYPHMEAPQWHRPHQNCKMRYLNAPFCDVCSHKITQDVEYYSGDDTSDFPIAFFSSSDIHVETGQQVAFYDLSQYRPDTWSWTFEGGDPAESSDQNPVVTYGEPGQHTVRLEVANEVGQSELVREAFIHVSEPVGISPVPIREIYLQLYPNPASDLLQAEYDPAIEHAPYRVLNTLGEQVLSGSFDGSINVSSLPPGVYILQVDGPGQQVSRRFIKH